MLQQTSPSAAVGGSEVPARNAVQRKGSMERRSMLKQFAGIVSGGSLLRRSGVDDQDARSEHVAWVSGELQRMLTASPGMTRNQLEPVFTMEGGLSTAARRTYVSRECPYFKVDVDFKPADSSGRNGNLLNEGWSKESLLNEDDEDVIVKISRPYLQFSIAD